MQRIPEVLKLKIISLYEKEHCKDEVEVEYFKIRNYFMVFLCFLEYVNTTDFKNLKLRCLGLLRYIMFTILCTGLTIAVIIIIDMQIITAVTRISRNRQYWFSHAIQSSTNSYYC